MIDWIWHLIAYSIPWPIYAVVGVIAALAVYRLLGWRGSLAALGIVGAIVLTLRGQQAGRNYQLAKDTKDAQNAIDKARAARDAADRLNADDQRVRDTDANERK